nr:hypothetical protein [Kutzneria buriramensis]WKX05965.1 hypothetical protein Q4V64_00025 [Kutzneria buriramensis]
MRADAEVVLNEAGRGVLAELCGVEPAVLARALPAFTVDDPKISTGREAALAQARWRAAGTVAGEAAFGCRLCTARRTGQALRAVRYLPRWQRVCVRHGRWLLDADADQPLEHLNLRGVPEVVVVAQRQWTGVARRCGAGRGGARSGVAWRTRWSWPGGGRRPCTGSGRGCLAAQAAPGGWRQRGHGSSAVADRRRSRFTFPEAVAVADALLDPAMAELVWRDSGAGRPRPLPADGALLPPAGRAGGTQLAGPAVGGGLRRAAAHLDGRCHPSAAR